MIRSPFARFFMTTCKMPRKRSVQNKNKCEGAAQSTSVASSQSGPVSLDKDGSVEIKVRVKPGAKRNTVTDISPESVGIQIAAPPVEGEANTELVRYLASVLNLRKSDVKLDKGSRSRSKAIKVTSENLSVEEVFEKLNTEIQS